MFIFLKISDAIYFLKQSSSGTQFIWSSEASGFRHLYLASVNSQHVVSRGRSRSFLGQNSVYYPFVTQEQLTEGDWEVDGKQVCYRFLNRFEYTLKIEIFNESVFVICHPALSTCCGAKCFVASWKNMGLL